jgi:hypothetical protein
MKLILFTIFAIILVFTISTGDTCKFNSLFQYRHQVYYKDNEIIPADVEGVPVYDLTTRFYLRLQKNKLTLSNAYSGVPLSYTLLSDAYHSRLTLKIAQNQNIAVFFNFSQEICHVKLKKALDIFLTQNDPKNNHTNPLVTISTMHVGIHKPNFTKPNISKYHKDPYPIFYDKCMSFYRSTKIVFFETSTNFKKVDGSISEYNLNNDSFDYKNFQLTKNEKSLDIERVYLTIAPTSLNLISKANHSIYKYNNIRDINGMVKAMLEYVCEGLKFYFNDPDCEYGPYSIAKDTYIEFSPAEKVYREVAPRNVGEWVPYVKVNINEFPKMLIIKVNEVDRVYFFLNYYEMTSRSCHYAVMRIFKINSFT